MKGLSRPRKRLGAWVGAWVDNTNYQAATDGHVLARGALVGASHVTSFTNTGTPANTNRQEDSGDQTGSISMPVRKGDYWRTLNATANMIFWIPLEP